jgi:imidazolonepropionase-like amidohydrolase
MLAQVPATAHPVVLHAERLLDIEAGRILSPGEVLIEGEKIVAAGSSVAHPAGAETVDLGDTTLMPGLIDAHVHLFLHPGDEDLQTITESVPQRVIVATLAAKADLLAGFTAERDMGTEGAGSAATQSVFLVATKTPCTTTPSSTCSPTPPTPIQAMNW